MASDDVRRIAGVLARFWAGGQGPSRPNIESALLVAGHTGPTNDGNKQQLVLKSIVAADDDVAYRIVEELVGLLREAGHFKGLGNGPTERLQEVFAEYGNELTEDGHINWHVRDIDEPAVRAAPSRVRPAPNEGLLDHSSIVPISPSMPAPKETIMTDVASLTILFLDVKGYSRADMLATKQYVTKVLPLINEKLEHAVHRNTWGDAVLATFQGEEHAAKAALRIRDLFRELPGDILPANLQPRIALNRGQVLTCHNPIRDAPDIFGPAVNLAARLEPITLVGHVFCTDQVAKALSDMGELGSKATLYQQNAELPKGYGKIDVYVVTHRNEHPPSAPPTNP